MKRVHAENWSLRERLVLASSVLRSGDQNWMSVSRAMRAMADGERPADWYSQKQCAVQYEHLLNALGSTAMPKRKKRSLDASSLAADTPQEIIVRKLTQERIEELRAQLVELRASYLREKHEQEELLSGRLDSRLDEIEQANAERESESNRPKEQASPVKLEPTTPQPESKPTSPLLTSLLQMPSPALMHRSPTISSLLISSPPVPSPAVTPPRPIAATTLSQLLESPTIAVPAIQKSQSPSRSPTTQAPANNPPQNDNVEDELSEKEITEFLTELIPPGVGEQVLALDNVKDDLIDVKIEDIPLVETDPSAVVTDVDPTEVIVAAENIQTEEVVGKENTSIISSQTGDTTASAIDDTPDSDLIAETLSELADLDSRTVEMIVVGPNAQLAGAIKEELVEITSTDIDLATGEAEAAAAAAAATMKAIIIEGGEVVVEGEADTGVVIEETVVDSTVIVDNIVDFQSSIVEETVVQEEVVEKMEQEEEDELEVAVGKGGVEEVKVEEGEVGGGEEQQEVVEDEVVVETGETVVEEEEVVEQEEEGEEGKEADEKVEEDVVKEDVEEVAKEEERTEEEQVVSVEEPVVETTEHTLDRIEEAVKKEAEMKDVADAEESQDTREEETTPDESAEVKEPVEAVKGGGGEKEEEISEAEETVQETKEDAIGGKVGEAEETGVEEEEEEEGEKKKEEEEEEEEEGEATRADVSSAIAVAVNEIMSSSSTPSTPTSAVLPNILSIASDTVSTSRPETPSTEEDNEPVANLAKKIGRRHGGLSGSSSLPNSPLSINALEERAALHSWKKSIMLVYNRLATHKYASLFLKPITNEQARGYHSVIHRPMDLSTIKKNIEMGNLRTTVEFQRDMMLMFQNAIMYNNQTTLVYQMATQMQAECIQHIQLMVEAMGEGVPLRSDTDDLDTSKMTRGGRGKVESSQPSAVDSSRKRKRSSLPETTAGKKKKLQGDEEGKKN